MLAVDPQLPLFLLVENLAFTPRVGAGEKRKRKHDNHAVPIVTFYENKCRRMRPLGGRNPEFGVNHILWCLFYVVPHVVYILEYWYLCVLCLNIYFLNVISVHMIMFCK